MAYKKIQNHFTMPRVYLLGVLLALCTGSLFGQGSISGVVVDENDEPTYGAAVKIIELERAALTDLDGVFFFDEIPEGRYLLSIESLGYDKIVQSVNVGPDAEVNMGSISLVQDIELTEEIVVVGYGVSKKRDIVGAITKIDGADASDALGNSFESNLQGKAAGVQVLQSSGIAGSGARIRIRGTGSITSGGDPLYVIDGIPITQDPFINGSEGGQNYNPLSTINPNDIESIEILKDASAAAIYGSRGANGVVLITTKKGKTKKPKWNYNSNLGFSGLAVDITDDYLTTSEWIQLNQEAWENDGNVGRAPLPGGMSYDDLPAEDYDWFDALLRTGIKQEHNLSVAFGKEKLDVYASFNYLNTESYQVGNNFERLAGRLNLGYTPIKWFNVNLRSSLSQGLNNRVSQAWDGGLGTAESTLLPFYSVDSFQYATGQRNPLFKTNYLDWNTLELRTINNLTLALTPVKNLQIKAFGGLDYMDLRDSRLEDSLWTLTDVFSKLDQKNITNYMVNGTVDYRTDFWENHTLSLLGGWEYQQSTTVGEYTEIKNALGHIYNTMEVYDSPNADTTVTEYDDNQWRFTSSLFRLNYNFKDKLIVNMNHRIDASSKFGKDRKTGHFPGLGLAYIMSEDSWLANSDKISFLKVRASVGRTGNADIPYDAQFGGYSPGSSSNLYAGQPIVSYASLPNSQLAWETTWTTDAGIEVGFLRDRITAELGYYNKITRDAIIFVRVPTSTGQAGYFDNIAQIRNRGVEFMITSRNLVGDRFSWRTDLNLTHNRNKVIDVGTAQPDALAGSGDTRVIEGMPMGVNYLVRFSHVDPDNGLPVFLDADGNETYEWSEENRVPVGNVQPKVVGGLTNTFTIGQNLEIEILGTFTIGGNIYDDAAKRQLGVWTEWNMQRDILNRWTGPGDVDAIYPRLTRNSTTYGGMGSEWFYNTDQWLYDASYFRLKKLAIKYSLPKKLFANKSWIAGCDVGFTTINLFTIAAYRRDPEIVRDLDGPQAMNLSPNVTYLTPPQERTFNFSVNVNF